MRHTGVLGVAMALVGCGASPSSGIETVARTPAPRASRDVAVTAAPARRTPSDENARAVADALGRVAVLRGLPAKSAVASRTLSRAQIADHVKAHVAREVPDHVVDGSTALLVGLGVVPTDFDYVASFLVFMSSEIAGLYEPDDDTMYLAEDLDGATRDMTLAHELVHALQDQHYDLGTLLDYAPGQGDTQAALHALAEGDATSLMMDAMLEPRGQTALDMPESLMRMQVLAGVELSPGVQDVPGIIRRSVIAPYVDGLAFVNALRRRGGWAAVDAAWQRGVPSTEQLLHPDKQAADERPERVEQPSPPGTGYTLVYADRIGEQGLRLLFEEWMPTKTAHAAAADWAGDHVAVFRDGDTWSISGRFRWDHEAGATRGLAALARGAAPGETSRSEAERRTRSGGFCVERDALGPFAALRRGRDVALVLGPFERHGTTATSRGSCVTARALAASLANGQ